MVSLRVNLAQPTRHRNRFRRVGAVKPGPSKHNTCANAWRDVRVGALPAPRLFSRPALRQNVGHPLGHSQ